MAILRNIVAFSALALAVAGAVLDDRTQQCGTATCIPGIEICGRDQDKDICVPVPAGVPANSGNATVTSVPFGNSTTVVATSTAADGNSSTLATTTATATDTTTTNSESSSSSGQRHTSTLTSKQPPPSGAAVVPLGPAVAGMLGFGAVAALGVF